MSTLDPAGTERRLRQSLMRRAAARHSKPIAAMVALGIGSMGVIGYGASAAVPAFPNNIVVFPDRDFVTVEGYQDHIGETATLRVKRGDTVIGSAQAVVQEGDVAFEVNHPGGACWGAGTNLDVTPDIQPGDTATISFDGDDAGDTTVQDAAASVVNYVSGASAFTVEGHIGGDVNKAQIEQRIVNPDLTDTAVSRRDVRAVPGGLTRAPKGGYSSDLEVHGDTFVATYVFDDPEVARIAASGGGARMMAWQVEDGDGNRQGLSIAELGESGGPGMGGCPAGPTEQTAPAPGTAAVVRSADKDEVQVSWTPATAAPGSTPVSGYSVVAVADTVIAGQKAVVGRQTDAAATRASITGLNPEESYTVQVRSLAGSKASESFTVQAPSRAPGAPSGDLTPATITASPAPNSDGTAVEARSVTLSTNESADIYYTTDGSPALDNGDLPADAAKLYTGAIAITSDTVIRFAAFDEAGNVTQGLGRYTPPTQAIPVPNAPITGASTAGQGTVTLRWSSTDTTITGYGVQLYDADGAKVGALRETAQKTLTIDELAAGTYTFTVKAQNTSGYGIESAKSGDLTVTPVTDRLTIGTARWKTGDFRVTGTGSSVGATITIRANSPTGTVLGSGRITTAVAPATGGVFDLRFRDGQAPTPRPTTIYVVSSLGGVAGPFTVAAG